MSARRPLKIEIADIGDLERDELISRWKQIYRASPPVGVRRELLRHAIAWELQSKRLGGLSGEAKRALKLAISEVASKLERSDATEVSQCAGMNGPASAIMRTGVGKVPASARRTVPPAGARLIREWNGKTNVVDVMSDGYLFEGKSYRSLTAIAHKITEAHWSGPRFFGL